MFTIPTVGDEDPARVTLHLCLIFVRINNEINQFVDIAGIYSLTQARIKKPYVWQVRGRLASRVMPLSFIAPQKQL